MLVGPSVSLNFFGKCHRVSLINHRTRWESRKSSFPITAIAKLLDIWRSCTCACIEIRSGKQESSLSSSFPRVERVLRELSADVIFVVIAIPLLCSLFLSLFCYTGSSDDHLAILCVHLLEHAILFIAIAHLYSCAYLKCFRLWNEARNYNKRDFNLRVE
jgi:hypothetical protein